jgi:FkbM family methyltransferase
MERVTEGHVFCFEPSPGIYRILSENMFACANVTCFDLACSDHTGRTTFSVSGSSGLHHIAQTGAVGSIDARPRVSMTGHRRIKSNGWIS